MSLPSKIPLYRVENPTIPYNHPADDAYFNSQLAGQWFDMYFSGAMANVSRVSAFSTRYKAPAQLAIAVVMSDELDSYHASNHPIASYMNHFQEDYIIPRDGSVPILEIAIPNPRNREQIADLAASIIKTHIGRDLIVGPNGTF